MGMRRAVARLACRCRMVLELLRDKLPGVAWRMALCALLVTVGAAAPALAADVPLDPALGESVVFIRNRAVFPVELETTLFRPPGDGPFPVVVINHGKASGNNRLDPRSRPLVAVREFLQRGYAVMVPMRQGFANSGGRVSGEGCNFAANGAAQAEDVHAVVQWLADQPWADITRMVMLGQSHGGLTTLAYARRPHPGFKLFVNFAGGLKIADDICPWRSALVQAFAQYGAVTRTPTLWFYGVNDSFFPPEIIDPAHAAYVAAGGPAEMVHFGPFAKDAHALFASARGLPIWWPYVQRRLEQAGLPTQTIFPQFAPTPPLATPPPTGYAALGEVEKLPYLRGGGRAGYKAFIEAPLPRAFALSARGAWGWAAGGDDAAQKALDNCTSRLQSPCQLYAVDADVVWAPAVSTP